MKHLKTFEYVVYLRDISVGDYVLLDETTRYTDSGYISFLNNNIGQIVEIYDEDRTVKISYKNVPIILKRWLIDGEFAVYNLAKIKYHAKTKEEIEAMIASEKYNL